MKLGPWTSWQWAMLGLMSTLVANTTEAYWGKVAWQTIAGICFFAAALRGMKR